MNVPDDVSQREKQQEKSNKRVLELQIYLRRGDMSLLSVKREIKNK